MKIFLVMQNVSQIDPRTNGLHEISTRPISAHYSRDSACDTIFEKYRSIRKQSRISEIIYEESSLVELEYTYDLENRVKEQWRIRQWIEPIELEEKRS